MNIFIFHRDFRIEDNRGLIALAQEEQEIYLVFIFTNKQIENNSLFNSRAFQAMIFCLQELSKKNHINFVKAHNELDAIKDLIADGAVIKKIFTNKDFSPYALLRSLQLKNFAQANNIIYREFHDYMLFAPHEIKKADNSFYQVFTPYGNQIRFKPYKNQVLKTPRFRAMKLKNNLNIMEMVGNDFNLPLTRAKVKEAVTLLSKNYPTRRNNLALYEDGTSHISTAVKFGVVSIREVHAGAIKRGGHFDNPFSRQLIGRDFFYQAIYNAMRERKGFFGNNGIKKMDHMVGENNRETFLKGTQGKTGVPLVDAGMHELNVYGTMHNRVRMVCASYLVKNLNIDGRWGERYFAKKLIDYDPIVNQCSGQGVAGTGFDAQPFIRIFNPYLQQTKFDPDLVYTHHFLPNPKTTSEIVDFKSSYQAAKKRYHDLK